MANPLIRKFLGSSGLLLSAFLALPLQAQEANELNLYSARHYQTDEALYSDFTKKTGIKINRIEADDNALAERLKSEGANSPADVILMVDAARYVLSDCVHTHGANVASYSNSSTNFSIIFTTKKKKEK